MSEKDTSKTKYIRFFAMIGTSMFVMFGLTYLNSFRIIDHAWFSETRLFMTLMMGAAMMAIMLGFMQSMYRSRSMNLAIYILAGAMFLAGLGLVRSQATVSDIDYMQGMIPHHSIAILTSERARISDPRVRELADEIIAAQRREIKEMEWLIADIRENGRTSSQSEANSKPVPSFSSEPE
jgi:hypothetical protein